MLISVGMDTLFADILFKQVKKERFYYKMYHRHRNPKKEWKYFSLEVQDVKKETFFNCFILGFLLLCISKYSQVL